MSARPDHPVKTLIPWILSALWFAGWHIWHTYDIWKAPAYLVPGPIGDNTVMLWNVGWVTYALNHGSLGFWFPNAYYPQGFFFLFGTHTWLDGLLAWLISPIFPAGFTSSILFVNFNLLFGTVATGLLILSALRAWGVSAWPVRLCVASAITFSWFRMFALSGHYHFYGTHWMLAALTLTSWAHHFDQQNNTSRAWRFYLMSGFLLGITFLNDQTMFVFAALLIIPILWSSGKGFASRFRRVSVVYCTALIPASLHLVPMARALAAHAFQYRVDNWTPRLVDVTSLFLPPDRHILGPTLQPLRDKFGLFWSEGTYLGVIPIALLILTLVYGLKNLKRNSPGNVGLRRCLPAGLIALGLLIIALGDRLVIGSHQYFYLPEILFKKIPVLNAIRLPQRWVWPAHLCIGLGGGITLQVMWDNTRRRALLAIALLALACLPAIEGQSYPRPAPVDYRDQEFLLPPALISAVKENYRDGGVLTMPVERGIAHNNIFQFVWGYDIPVTLAYTARMPENHKALPWKDAQWTPESGRWLVDHRVKMVVFPYDSDITAYADWLRRALLAVPDLQVVTRHGLTTVPLK